MSECGGISVDDLEMFKDALVEENLPLQIEIIQKLQSLAKAVGENTTRDELLPFIERNIDLHDEILLNLSEQLKHFIPLVGGIEHASSIFDILIRLCTIDENVVREKAVETLIYLGQDLTNQQIEDYLFPVIDKLIHDDWFASKCSAVMLFSPFYSKVGDEKKAELRNSFKILIQDDVAMVRKAAALAFADFVSVLEDKLLKSEFIPIFCDIAKDPMDTVKSVTIDIAIALSKQMGENELDESIFKVLEAACDDPSWKLRQRLAISIPFLQQQIPFPKFRGKIIALFQKLTQDIEPEVRTLAATHSFSYCKYLLDSYVKQPQFENNFEPVFEQSIMPVIKKLILDDVEDVRSALSTNILALSRLISEECFKRNMIPLLLKVLEEEESIAIKANFLQGLSRLSSKVDLSQSLHAIKCAVKTVIVRSQSNWRTRRSILMTFVDIARFCDAEYFSTHFKVYYAALLGDAIFAVRRNASLVLPLLSKHYGIKWASENLIPYFTLFTKDVRYLYRFVPLFGISEMINSTHCHKPEYYLKDYKIIIEDKENVHKRDAALALATVVKTHKLIDEVLCSEKYSEILKLKDDLDYLSNTDTSIYLEDTVRTQSDKYNKVNIYSVDEDDFKENHQTYLQGILTNIFNKFLPIIEALNNDKIVNVQIRAICTLSEISEFIKTIGKEISEPWVNEVLESLASEELEVVDQQVPNETQRINLDEEPEKIDTNLMDENGLNLIKSISVENSNLKIPLDENKNLVNKEDRVNKVEKEASNVAKKWIGALSKLVSKEFPDQEAPEHSEKKENIEDAENKTV